MFKIYQLIHRFFVLCEDVSFKEACIDLYHRLLKKCRFPVRGKRYYMLSNDVPQPTCMRFGTSDAAVYWQIFVKREYQLLDQLKDVKVVVDCGANVGYSSLYFLNKFPGVQVIALEPAQENLEICQKNTKFFSKQITLKKAGVWSRSTGLIVERKKHKEHQEWAYFVRECQNGEVAEIPGVDLESLIEQHQLSQIDLLKIDIERSELEIFTYNFKRWLSKVKNICIELHNEECKKAFFKALEGYSYDLNYSGELTICRNLMPKLARALK